MFGVSVSIEGIMSAVNFTKKKKVFAYLHIGQ
jgi:hypothetical protein